jgi:hypothetical protein
MGRMKTTALTCGAMLFLLCFSSYGQLSAPNIDNRVAALIEKTLSEKTEQKAFADIEALGCPAVSAIIGRMDDRRKLPVPRISLRNKSPQAFEELRHWPRKGCRCARRHS